MRPPPVPSRRGRRGGRRPPGPAPASSASGPVGLAVAHLHQHPAPGLQVGRRLRRRSRRSPRRRSAPTPAPPRARSAARAAPPPGRAATGRAGWPRRASKRRPPRAAKPSESTHSTASRASLARATARASSERSRAVTRRPGPSSASASATAPLPVPQSSTEPPSGTHRQGPLHQHLGLGARHQHPRAHLELQAAERAPAGEVGQRLAAAAAADQVAGAIELGRRQRPLRVGVELDALDPEGVREQQVGVEARRGGPPLGQVGRAAPQDLPDAEGPAHRRPLSGGRAPS